MEKYGVGKIFTNTQGYEAVVIEKIDRINRKIIFLSSKYEAIVEYNNLAKGMFKDYGSPSVYGVGIAYKNAHKKNPKVYKTWSRMLERCYAPSNKNDERLYKDVKVCDRWIVFSNFEDDIKEIPGYEKYINDKNSFKYSLDKDIKGNGKIYCKDFCMFATWTEQTVEAVGNHVVSISASGERITHRTINEACRKLGVQNANVYKVLNGERKSTLGYKFERLNNGRF